MRLQSHHLELLSPARDAAIAREAILHGADAVYIGGHGFGARHNASNSLRDIADFGAVRPPFRGESVRDPEHHSS